MVGEHVHRMFLALYLASAAVAVVLSVCSEAPVLEISWTPCHMSANDQGFSGVFKKISFCTQQGIA